MPVCFDTYITVISAQKEREKVQKAAQKKTATPSDSRATSPPPKTPKKANAKKNNVPAPSRKDSADPRQLDLSGLNLVSDKGPVRDEEPPPKTTFARDKLIEEAKKKIEATEKKGVNLVVIGHVDAGKSTLMGRLLYELGRLDEKTRNSNERGSSKAGKSSFSWAWGLDGTTEERERGITMDIAQQTFSTQSRQITVLDAPGHKDFVPNMISGASQADCALLVVDSSTGEFEAGFDRGGQTREHLLLVRSLGVSQVVVAVNKLDQVSWDKGRYEDIVGLLKPFLVQSGFHPSKTQFVPVAAMLGVNLAERSGPDAVELSKWYNGPTLVDLLNSLEPPARDVTAPLRIPISNVFKGSGAGTSIAGRICGGVVQIGEKLRILPGDETAIVKSIEVEEEMMPWAASGSNVILQLTLVDPIYLNIGNVLCLPNELVPLATVFTARIIVFDVDIPITSGASVELFHHSRDVPVTITKLLTTLDRATGAVTKKNPRVLVKGSSAEVQITLRGGTLSSSMVARPIPLEPFGQSKDMGRILIRRGGETIGAGIVLEIFA